MGLVALMTSAARARATDAPQPPQPPPPVIEYRNDTLTVKLVNIPLDQVLGELARQTHAEIRGELTDNRHVTAQFEAVPLPEALDRLLADQNYALIYGADGSLRAIPLLNGSAISSGPSIFVGPAKPSPSRPVNMDELAALLSQQVPITGPVAEALGTDTASLGQLASLWLHGDDPALGAQALRSGFKAAETNTDMRAATLDVANNYSDADLAQLFRRFAGSRAEELLDLMASQTRVTEFRSKATTVLNRLRSGG
jgi:hypothetical protein